MATLLPEGKQSFQNNAGAPLVGGKVYTYDAGTNNPRATYQDAAGTVPNTNPIILDARGEATVFWSGAYKVVLKDALDNTIWTVDNVQGVDPSTLTSSAGAGLVGFLYAAVYAAGSIGKWLQDLALATGASFIGWLQAGAGAVLRTVQAKLRDELNVKDFGAVANGAFVAGGAPSGTDNLAAFNATLTAAVTLGITRVKASGVYYLSGKLTLPRGVILEGDGTAHLPIFLGGTIRGTVLLINGSAADDCLAFEENAGHSGLRDISIYHTNTNAVRGVVSVVGHLYPRMKNVEIAALRKSAGNGLYLRPSSTGALFETLWGDFDNVIVTITNVSTGTEASVRWGLQIYGNTPTSVCNANSFRAGQFAGTWGGLLLDGAVASSGALSCVFHGVKFDTNWDGTFAPQYQAAASGVFGYTKANCYIYPVVQIKRGISTAFHGCYFEAAGAPATYNDGVNGVNPLIAVVWNDSAAECIGTAALSCNWNSCFLYDKGTTTFVSPTTDRHRHDTSVAVHVGVRTGGVQSVPNAAWTKVATATVLFGDDNEAEWDAVNGVVKIRSPGTYLVVGQIEFAGWATAGTFATCRVSGGGYTYQGSTNLQQGAGITITPQVTALINLVLGDTLTFEAFQSQGGAQNTSGANTYLSVVKVG